MSGNVLMKIQGVLVIVALVVSGSTAQAGPFNHVARWLGLGWSDGYHARYGMRSAPVGPYDYRAVQELPSSAPPWQQLRPGPARDLRLQGPSPGAEAFPQQDPESLPVPRTSAGDAAYESWLRPAWSTRR